MLRFFELNSDDIIQSTKNHDLDKKLDHCSSAAQLTKEDLRISGPIKSDEFVCAASYKAIGKNELSVRKGARVIVMEKNLNGWWFVDSSSDGQGYVPQCVLKPLDGVHSNQQIPILSYEKRNLILFIYHFSCFINSFT